ncbi:class I SAM-dependent methyltransferase [Dactylosporangium sp. NPDC000244]|uniref:class I SAM-dependent methyltransferase n=1 Tax=Dactylosporangium sp. NPDC000244 TaxID=3154365 RepID=UPI00331BABAC
MSLFAGAAEHYPVGRRPYPAEFATALRDELGLDGTGRLLDVGCGPGSLTTLLAPLFAAAVGVDADPDMIAVAARRAPHIDWHVLRGEDLPAGLGTFRVVTFAQSFHWMDQPLVAARVRAMLDPHGAWVHVGGQTHRGVDGPEELPLPRPPWDAVDALVRSYAGPRRPTRSGEEDVMRAAGYRGPVRLAPWPGEVVERSADELVSAVFSLSSSAPPLFGDRLGAFEADLRRLLAETSPQGRFAERMGPPDLIVWRP